MRRLIIIFLLLLAGCMERPYLGSFAVVSEDQQGWRLMPWARFASMQECEEEMRLTGRSLRDRNPSITDWWCRYDTRPLP